MLLLLLKLVWIGQTHISFFQFLRVALEVINELIDAAQPSLMKQIETLWSRNDSKTLWTVIRVLIDEIEDTLLR